MALALLAVSFQTIDHGAVDSTVRGAADIFAAQYFDVPLATRVSADLKRRLDSGEYVGVRTNQDVARRLTSDLLDLTHDKHVVVSIRRATTAIISSDRRDVPTTNGFTRTEILRGNVGVLEMAFFLRPVEHRDALEAAMRRLQPADALILDMRQNGGGSPDTVTLLISYLLDGPGRPLFEIRPRIGSARTYVTEAVPLDLRNARRPIYVLTSTQSFSGGEGLAFVLQDLKRAVTIGEVTAGAANPGRPYPINDTFEIQVPNGQLLTSASHRNWEGRGVIPDIPAAAKDALRIAHLKAIDDLIADMLPGPKRDGLARVRAELNGG